MVLSMVSPASQHKANVLAKRKVHHNQASETTKQFQLARMMHIRLANDQRELLTIRSWKKRNQAKRELIHHYADYLHIALNRAQVRHDEIVVTLCVWCCDCGDYSRALPLLEHAIEHNMNPPKGFERSLLEIAVEVVASHALHKNNAIGLRDVLERFYNLSNGRDMYDLIAAKLRKALAIAVEPDSPEWALVLYEEAKELNPRLAVQRAINRLTKQLEQ